MLLRIARALLATALLAFGSYATAQYPTKTVKLIVPFPAGQATDLAARVIAEAQARTARWELNRISQALTTLPDVPVVGLKGVAYLLASTANSAGRQFSDVDLLVPETHLDAVEQQLVAHGWSAKELRPYDELYYRRWAHELPPFTHPERDIEVDLHHNLVMRTARIRPSAALLIASSVAVPNSRFRVLEPVDMTLHSMVHLFYGGELGDSLRELFDIDVLLRDPGDV